MKGITDKHLYDVTLNIEDNAIKTISVIWNCNYITTNKVDNRFSKIDGLFIRDNIIKGIYEVKTRTQTYSWFKDYKSMIISYDKITDGAIISRILNTPFFAIFRTSCKRILVFQITDNNGNLICPMNIRYTETQKSSTFDKGLNNKKIIANAYLMLDDNPNLFIFNEEQYESRVLEKYGSNDK